MSTEEQPQVMKRLTRILIATPMYGGQLSMGYFLSFLRSLGNAAQLGYQLGVYTLANESLIPRARNRCAAHFLTQTPFDKLMFIDADIEWRWEDMLTLLESGEPLIAGVYPAKTLPLTLNFNPEIEHAEKYFPNGRRDLASFKKFARECADPFGEVAVRQLTTGFMLIDRSVLEKLKDTVPQYSFRDLTSDQEETHWDFFPTGPQEGTYASEDYGFCELAKKAGFTPTLHTRALVSHYGTHLFKPNEETSK